MGVGVLILMMVVVAGPLTMRFVLGQERNYVFYVTRWRRRRRRGEASGQRLTRRVGGKGGGRGAVGEGGGHAWLAVAKV
jgi:hypothetical protein